MEMQALIEEIASLIEKVKSGTATLGELEAFASAAQQLNERAIILRYKAYEAKVYASTPADFDSAVVEEKETPQAKTEEPIVEMSTPASVEESEDLSFDLFSMDDSEPEPIVETIEEPALEIPEIEEKEEEIIDEPAATFTPEIKEETPIIEEPIAEVIQPVFPETDVQPEQAPAAPISSETEHPVIRKARTDDGSMQSRLLSVRLETLKSAFGLNERMLIVRELFQGSNEAYSEAIEQLDNQSEISSARSKVADYANRYGWREDNELAVEFVQKVERRYA